MVVSRVEAVIWDFNGTLVDDLDLVVQTVNKQLDRRGLPLLTTQEYRDVFGFPVEDYYRRIGLDFENESMAELAADFFSDYAPQLRNCSLHDDAFDVLDELARSGIRQFVLSAMEEGMLAATLETLGIRDHFVAAYGLKHQEADSKISRGRDLLVDFGICAETALLVGDTDHDAEVAGALGVSVVLIAGGHQSAARLRATGCPVYGSFADLRAVLAR